MNELPHIASTTYGAALAASPNLVLGGLAQFQQWNPPLFERQMAQQKFIPKKQESQPVADIATTRLVKVFIVDPDINVPLERRLIYRGDEKVTDLTDQELFFEIDINGLLKKHNEFRVTVEDKKANKDKPVLLEAARVRDLKMQVIVLAQF